MDRAFLCVLRRVLSRTDYNTNNDANTMMRNLHLILAQSELTDGLGKVAGIINSISMILFFAALVMSGVMFASGRTEHLKYGLVGTGVGALSWILTKAFFQASGSDLSDIILQKF